MFQAGYFLPPERSRAPLSGCAPPSLALRGRARCCARHQPGLLRFGLRFVLGENAGDAAEVVLDARFVRVLVAKLAKLGSCLCIVFRLDKLLYFDLAIRDRIFYDMAGRRGVLFTLLACGCGGSTVNEPAGGTSGSGPSSGNGGVSGSGGSGSASGASGSSGGSATGGASGSSGGSAGRGGSTGATGDTGATGYPGATGSAGSTGDTGATGRTGRAGATGDTGGTVVIVPAR